ncbi:MAG: D-aminoacylase [Alphaproteobacteria bacterium]
MAERYDLLIRNADVYDGSGAAPTRADVAVEGERIVLVGDAGDAEAAKEIDAAGLALAPGFIDVHTHDDFAALTHPSMSFKTRGGVTTCVVGNCGFGAAPYKAAADLLGALTDKGDLEPWEGYAGYMETLATRPLGANIAVLAGHGTIRMSVMGRDSRAPTDDEMEEMKGLMREALSAGVVGLSTGLIYEPGRYAKTDEIAEVAAEMRGTGALYATHMRDEGKGLLASVQEAIEIGERAGVPVQISHHKASGRSAWGLVKDSLKLIESAQERGESVHADQYPYTAGSTMLRSVLQNGALQGNVGGDGGISEARPADLVIASAPGHPEWEGKSVEQLAKMLDMQPRAAAEHVAKQAEGASVILHMMTEDDVQTVLRHPSTMIGSDGIPTLDGKPHPRLYNTFARVLGHYARDLSLMPVEEAVHRMTGFCADKFGLADRGYIREGCFADLVLFDAGKVIDKGTFDDPNQYPEGIVHVFVNGGQVVDDALATEVATGQVLRRAI